MTGTFDNWSKSYPLVKQTDGSFELTVPLDTSKEVLYKYVVDGEWTVNDKQKTVSDDSGIKNNVLELSAVSASKGRTESRIPEAGGLAAAAVAGSSASNNKDLKTTVMPSTEGQQTTLGEPGIFIPKDKEALAAFENVRDVDPKSLNENKDDEKFTKEMTPEEKKKHKKKLKKTQYKLRKKQQKKAAAAGAVAGGAAGEAENGEDNDNSCDSEEEKTPEASSSEATATGALIGAVGGAAAGGIGGAVLGAFGGATAGQAADEYAHEHHGEIAQKSPKADEGAKTLDPGRQAKLEIPGSISGVDRVATRDDEIAASKTRTTDTTTSSDFVDTTDGVSKTKTVESEGFAAGAAIPEERGAENVTPVGGESALEKQKKNTKDYPVEGGLTGSGAAAVPITAVEESSEPAAPVSQEKSTEPGINHIEEQPKDSNTGAIAAGALGGAGAAGLASGAAAPAVETSEPSVPVETVSKEAPVQAAPIESTSAAAEPLSEQPRAEGGEVAGVFGSAPAVAPLVGPKEVSAKEVDASPVTKGEDHLYDGEDEIIIAQGGESVKQVEKKILEQEGGDVSVEQIQPSPCEARRLAEEAHLLKQAQLAAERAQEVASPKNPPAGPAKPAKATPAQKSPKKVQKAPSAAQQEATKTKKGILSKLKKLFK